MTANRKPSVPDATRPGPGMTLAESGAPVPSQDYMGFVGVSTGSSSIMRCFPAWADLLGLPTRQLVGHDLPLDAPLADIRALVERIRDDPDHRGALVTTHKISVYDAASDLFHEIDEFASLCGEVSSIAKRGSLLVGHAKDPITAGLALEELLPPRAFTGGAEAVCLGAGGAGIATTWYLGDRVEHPARIVCSDTDPARLGHLRSVHEEGGLDPELFSYVLIAGAEDSDRLVGSAPPGSLVINATGLGKDRPGSPLSDAVLFPERAVAWDLNYRGDLGFLVQARAQAADRDLTVVDGWRYFIHGWTQVIAEVFGLELTPGLVDELAAAAADVR